MLTLTLIRHAKAEALADSDSNRILADKGRQDARHLGQLFPRAIKQPDVILVSDARRTTQTYELMTENGLSCDEVLFDNALYHAGADAILTLLQARHEQHVMVIGHNPAMAILLNRLVPEEQVQPTMMHFPTGSLAQINFACQNFADIAFDGSGKLISFLRGSDI